MEIFAMPKTFCHGDEKTGITFELDLQYCLPDGISFDESLFEELLPSVLDKLFRKCVLNKSRVRVQR